MSESDAPDLLVAAAPPIDHSASGHTLLSNAGALIGGQLLGMIAPLLTIPYLARTLGPAAWGPVLMAQSLANWLVTILEFAFDLSGTRAIARSRLAVGSMTEAVHGVQSAKILLACVSVPVAAVAAWSIPTLRAAPLMLTAALVFSVARGLSPLWYFQGVERVREAVAVDSASKVAAAAAVFWLVHDSADGWRVIGLQAIAALVALLWMTRRLVAEVPMRMPEVTAARTTIRDSLALFAMRASAGLYVQANTLILGAIAPAAVAFFGGAERIIRAAVNLLTPINQATMPRVTYLQHTDVDAADQMVRRGFLVMGTIGLAMTLTAALGAPVLVHYLLGPEYSSAVPILRVLSLLPLLVSLTAVLGMLWGIPYGHERLLLRGVMAAGAANVLGAFLLVPPYGAKGMAIAVIGAEVVLFIILATAYLRRPRRADAA